MPARRASTSRSRRLRRLSASSIPTGMRWLQLSASAASLSNQLVARIEAQPYDAAMTLRLLQKISNDADEISNEGERAAEQAAMALDSLFIAYSRTEKMANAAEIRTAINGLFQQLENPSTYNPADFARQMRKVNSLLR